MKQEKKVFRIIVLEDSEFFNNMLTKQIDYFTSILAMEKNCRFEIQSCVSTTDFLRNLKHETDIAFVDYYLENGITGADMIEKIKEQCWDCKVVVISQEKNIRNTVMSSIDEGVDFVFKDLQSLPKCCFILEDIFNGRFSSHQLN